MQNEAIYDSFWEIGDRLPSMAAVQAVAAFRGVDPTEMVDTLHEYVDPDAVDTLLQRSTDAPVAVSFRMGDEVVELSNDGSLAVREQAD